MNVDFVPFIRSVRVLCKPRHIFCGFYPCAHKINHVMTGLMSTAIIYLIYLIYVSRNSLFSPFPSYRSFGEGGGGGICIKAMDVQLTGA